MNNLSKALLSVIGTVVTAKAAFLLSLIVINLFQKEDQKLSDTLKFSDKSEEEPEIEAETETE